MYFVFSSFMLTLSDPLRTVGVGFLPQADCNFAQVSESGIRSILLWLRPVHV